MLCGAVLVLLLEICVGELIGLFTLSRHGERSPCKTFPNDPHSSLWVDGLCQLNSKGAKQLEMSTDTQRTLLSAEYFIRGLFENQTRAPIYSVHRNADMLLKVSNDCPLYFKLLEDKLKLDYMKEQVDSFDKLVSVFKENTGVVYSESKLKNFKLTMKLCDAIVIWYQQNFTYKPSWADSFIYSECSRVAMFKHSEFYSGESINKLRGGPLSAHVMQIFIWLSQVHSTTLDVDVPCPFDNLSGWNKLPDAKSNVFVGDKVKPLKLISYFAHDSTIAALLNHWGVFNGIVSPLASTVLVELHKLNSTSTEGNFTLKFFYRNATNTYHRLWPKFCGQRERPCYLDEFWNAIQGTYDPEVNCDYYSFTDYLVDIFHKICTSRLFFGITIGSLIYVFIFRS